MMLTIAKIGSPSDASSYYADDNYYTEDEGIEYSWWQGEGANDLELNGNIDPETFKSLLSGRIDTDTQLGKHTKKGIDHRPGWDFTFSAPKSVSILSELYGVEELRQAHEKAVKSAINYAENNLFQARVNMEGRTKFKQTKKGVFAAFTHDVSREQDPQIHTHVIVINATKDDEKWRSLSPERMFKQQKNLNQHYRKTLITEIKKLGFSLRPSRHHPELLEIAGVHDSLIDTFSVRSKQIREALEAKGIEYNAASARRASLETRTKKQNLARDDLKSIWLQRATSYFETNAGLSNDVKNVVHALQKTELNPLIKLDETTPIEIDEGIKFKGTETVEVIKLGEKEAYLSNVATKAIQNEGSRIVINDDTLRSEVERSIRKEKIRRGELSDEHIILQQWASPTSRSGNNNELESFNKNDKLTIGDESYTVIAKNREDNTLVLKDKNNNFTSIDPKDTQIKNHKRLTEIEIRLGESLQFKEGILKNSKQIFTRANVIAIEGDILTLDANGREWNVKANDLNTAKYDYVQKTLPKKQKDEIYLVPSANNLEKDTLDIIRSNKQVKVLATDSSFEEINSVKERNSLFHAMRATRFAIRELNEREMAVDTDTLLKTASRYAQHRGVTELAVINEINRLKQINYLRPAPAHPDKPNVELFTTQRKLEKEKQLAQTLTFENNTKPILTQAVAESRVDKKKLNSQQQAVVVNTLTSTSDIIGIQGDPGVGKTTTLAEIKKIARRNNFDILGLAPTHNTTNELADSLNIKGFTVDRALIDDKVKKSAKRDKSLWIVDEAGQLSIDKMNNLIKKARERGAKLLLVGDKNQLEAVDSGRPFALLQESGMPTFSMNKRMRQQTDELKSVVQDIIDKNYSKAFNTLSDNGNYTKTKNEQDSIQKLTEEIQSMRADELGESLIIVTTNQQRHSLDPVIRNILKQAGRIDTVETGVDTLTETYMTEQKKRHVSNYKNDHVIRFNKQFDKIGQEKQTVKRDQFLSIEKVDLAKNKLVLKFERGDKRITIDPRTLEKGSFSVLQVSEIKLSVGDKIRWRNQRNELGIDKNDEGLITKIDNKYLRAKFGERHVKIPLKDKRNRLFDYSYSQTAYSSQGKTAKKVIALAEGWRKLSVNQRSIMVAITRAVEKVKVFSSTAPTDLGIGLLKREASKTRAIPEPSISISPKLL